MTVPIDPPDPLVQFVTVDEAAAHLREVLDGMPADVLADLTLKITIASGVILDYLTDRGDPTWTETTAPMLVKAATLEYLAFTWEHRGDDDTTNTNFAEKTWQRIDLLLHRARDPVLR